MVTSRHRCDDSRILGLEARTLAARGYSVAWVGPDRGDRRDDEGIRYATFPPAPGLARNTARLARLLRATPARLYHCHEPDAALLALAIGKPRGSRVIFDAHEFFRAYMRERFPRGLKGLAGSAYFLFELAAYRWVDHLITVSDGVAEAMAKAVDRNKITVVANCSGLSVLAGLEPALPPAEFRILHLGAASFYHQLREMLEAFLLIRREVPAAEFLQIGNVPGEELEWMRAFVRTHGLQDAVRHLPRVPFEELGRYIPGCHVGLIARRADANATIGFPTKVFDYMTFGLPIVATDLVMLGRLNARFRVAILVDTTRPEAIAGAVLALRNDPGLRQAFADNAREALRLEYSWDHMGGRLLRIYESLLGPPAPQPAREGS
jgi:glycosyltransferase involved in cell wall biosynthesis